MSITTFEHLVTEALAQPRAQRLLFIFARAELPDAPTAEQQQRFRQGEGGVLVPVLCVDKPAQALGSMAALVEESRHTEVAWDLVFAAAMDDPGEASVVEQQLQQLTAALQQGQIGAMLAFDTHGNTVEIG